MVHNKFKRALNGSDPRYELMIKILDAINEAPFLSMYITKLSFCHLIGTHIYSNSVYQRLTVPLFTVPHVVLLNDLSSTTPKTY